MFTQGATRARARSTPTGQAQVAERRRRSATRMIGTAGDPSGANTIAAWQIVCANYSKMGELMLENYGIKAYLHPEQNNWQFIADPAHPGRRPRRTGSTSSSRTRTRGTCSSSPTSSTCTTPAAASRTRTARCGTRSPTCRTTGSAWSAGTSRTPTAPSPPVAPPGNPWEQTTIRPGFPLNGGVDVIYSTEGHLGNGAASAAQPGIAPAMLRLRPGATAPAAHARPGPARLGLPARVHGDHGQPRQGLQVPHRGVRQRSRPGRRPRPFAASRQDQRQAPARAQVAMRRAFAGSCMVRGVARAPLRACGRAGARRRFGPLPRDRFDFYPGFSACGPHRPPS